jgi:hypothetical protein
MGSVALRKGRKLQNQIKCKRHSLKGDITWPSRVARIMHPKNETRCEN